MGAGEGQAFLRRVLHQKHSRRLHVVSDVTVDLAYYSTILGFTGVGGEGEGGGASLYRVHVL